MGLRTTGKRTASFWELLQVTSWPIWALQHLFSKSVSKYLGFVSFLLSTKFHLRKRTLTSRGYPNPKHMQFYWNPSKNPSKASVDWGIRCWPGNTKRRIRKTKTNSIKYESIKDEDELIKSRRQIWFQVKRRRRIWIPLQRRVRIWFQFETKDED